MTEKSTNKSQIYEAAVKKKSCSIKAQAIVESLLEPVVQREIFLKVLNYIDQTHYADVVEERSILCICGYPLCDNNLTNIPKKKYQINIATKKVFDITERKKFCSTHCFKASEYIKKQISTCPLWLRLEDETPDYRLLDKA